MKLRAILTAGVLACLFSAEAAKPAGAAAVALSRDGTGHETFFVFGTGATGELAGLPAELKQSGYREADLSAWTNEIDCEALLDALSMCRNRAKRRGSAGTWPGRSRRKAAAGASAMYGP